MKIKFNVSDLANLFKRAQTFQEDRGKVGVFDFETINAEIEPDTATYAITLQQAETRGFEKGYHYGLREGYYKGKCPEKCSCFHCVSHGEMCNGWCLEQHPPHIRYK